MAARVHEPIQMSRPNPMQRTLLVITGLTLLMVLAAATPVRQRVRQVTATPAERMLRAVEHRFPALLGLGTVLAAWRAQSVSAAPYTPRHRQAAR